MFLTWHETPYTISHTVAYGKLLVCSASAAHAFLQELYTGTVKRVPVQRQKHDGMGHTVRVQEQLQVCVQPGIQEGTRITLPG